MRVYEGYGTGHPVYTIKGNQVFQGYGTGHPIYTIKGNQVYQGYGRDAKQRWTRRIGRKASRKSTDMPFCAATDSRKSVCPPKSRQ